jgi:CRISPR-associated protein Cmr6
MYLNLWGVDQRTNEVLWKTHDIGYEVRGQQRQERKVPRENKFDALKGAGRLNPADKCAMRALAERLAALAATVADEQVLRFDAYAIAPFTTGLGNEHPLENGFAFLSPYGLPYLPGSGVKGVLRQAARELASGDWGDTRGWSKDKAYPLYAGKDRTDISSIDIMFGLESQGADHELLRGALSFWDVVPQIKGDCLMVEIMTPHQSHYYQQKNDRKSGGSVSPHDSGQPTPITFLTVPPGSDFTFLVTCDTSRLSRLAPELLRAPLDSDAPQWKVLMAAAFEHAFEWLGFGAKTAVGYGAMNEARGADTSSQAKAMAKAAEAVWPSATLTFNPGSGEVKASFEGKVTTGLRGQDAENLFSKLDEGRARKLRKNKKLPDVPARVRPDGNMWLLLGLAES